MYEKAGQNVKRKQGSKSWLDKRACLPELNDNIHQVQ